MQNERAEAVLEEVKKAVVGKDECLKQVMMAFLSRGHVLIEDIPGVGKTTMALAFSKACRMEQRRVQFTPDVLPADITGFSIYRKETERFVYQPGAVMCNLFLADEINRTSPKTQSALLEVMEEGTVTVDGVTRQVPRPFCVIATQNPVGSAGTQLMPESQLDRFMICISMGYPDIYQEISILKDRSNGNPIDQILPVAGPKELLMMQGEVEQVFIHDAVYDYIARLVKATREHDMLELGVSPRGTLAIARMAKACAYLNRRDYVTPADVEAVFLPVATHRIRVSSRARVSRISPTEILTEILNQVVKPTPKRKGL